MATIVTRVGKGSPLTHEEVDGNFTNLNTDKLESTSLSVQTNPASGGGSLTYSNTVFTFTPADVSGGGGGGSFQPIKLDAISVVNGQASYTMQVGGVNHDPASDFALLVSLNGVIQAAGDAFSTTGSTITFIPALQTGDVIDFIIDLGNAVDVTTVVSTDTLDDVVQRGSSTTLSITTGGYATTTGTSAQFLKADGSVDSSTYLTTYSETDTLATVTGRGNATTNGITVGSIDVNGEIIELTRSVINVSGTFSINPTAGTVQRITLNGALTFLDFVGEGESTTLMIADSVGQTITWPTMTWIGGAAPTLSTTGLTVIQIWKANSVLYGALAGVAS